MGPWRFSSPGLSTAGARAPGCPADAGGEAGGAAGPTFHPIEPIAPELAPLYFLLPPSWTFKRKK